MMVSFIDTHRAAYGVEPLCRQLPIAPSMYYEQRARAADPERLPATTRRNQLLSVAVRRVWDENQQVYGAKKAWKQLRREQRVVARCTVVRMARIQQDRPPCFRESGCFQCPSSAALRPQSVEISRNVSIDS